MPPCSIWRMRARLAAWSSERSARRARGGTASTDRARSSCMVGRQAAGCGSRHHRRWAWVRSNRPVTLSDKPAGEAPQSGRRRAHDLPAVGLAEEAEMARPVDRLPVAAGEADAGEVAAEDHASRAEALP